MAQNANGRLRVGVLGAGQIAQAAHFESCTKASNTELYAICDVAHDLRERMAVAHGAAHTFQDYDQMLADPNLDAGDHRHGRRVPCPGIDACARGGQTRAL